MKGARKVKSCPACLSEAVHASHRLGFLEHGPYSWVGLLPFRCADCQTRFYRFAPSDIRRRRRGIDAVPDTDRVRPARWPVFVDVEVRLDAPEGATSLKGVAENASLEGLRVRLREAVREGRQIEVTFASGGKITGTVRWNRIEGGGGVLHGVQMLAPQAAEAAHTRPFRRLRRRWFLRRLLIGVIWLGVIAVATACLLWLIETLQAYKPSYYEPKDIERQRLLQQPADQRAKSPKR